jgi:hypothetical protein
MILKRASIHLMLITTSLLLIIIPAINKTPSQQVAEKAMTAAANFLFLIDTEEYLKSWENASNALKNILPRDAWHDQITEIRQLLGPIIDRDHQDISYTRSSPDVPSGEYVVLTFLSQFRDRAFATETVTVKLGIDDIWRVAGYFVRYGDPPPDV